MENFCSSVHNLFKRSREDEEKEEYQFVNTISRKRKSKDEHPNASPKKRLKLENLIQEIQKSNQMSEEEALQIPRNLLKVILQRVRENERLVEELNEIKDEVENKKNDHQDVVQTFIKHTNLKDIQSLSDVAILLRDPILMVYSHKSVQNPHIGLRIGPGENMYSCGHIHSKVTWDMEKEIRKQYRCPDCRYEFTQLLSLDTIAKYNEV